MTRLQNEIVQLLKGWICRELLGRTGRQPLYHIAIEELQEWAYTGEPLVPLKGYPGVVWQRSKKKKRADREGMV